MFEMNRAQARAGLLYMSAIGALLAADAAARAQNATKTPKKDQHEELVVHSSRSIRTHLQTQSLSATTVDQRQIRQNQITNLPEAIRLQPSVQFYSANLRNTTVNIRGLGAASVGTDGLENGAAIYIDGIYQARPGADLFDIPGLESISVLKGPQGTLGGVDETAGAVQIETSLPSFHRDIELLAQTGDYGEEQVQASVSDKVPGLSNVAFRLDYFQSGQDGYTTNVNAGQQYGGFLNRGVRGQMLILPTDNLSIRIIGGYSHEHMSGNGVTVYNGTVTHYVNGAIIANNFLQRAAKLGYVVPAADPYNFLADTDIDIDQSLDSEDANLSAHVDYNLHGYTFSSITAGSLWNFYPHLDPDATGIDEYQANQAQNYEHQITQEFRVASPTSGPVSWNAGTYDLWEEVDDHSRKTCGSAYVPYNAATNVSATTLAEDQAALNGLTISSREKPTTNSYSVYGNATWHIDSKWDLRGGLRYTYETKSGNFLQVLSGGENLAVLPVAERAAAVADRAAQLVNPAYQALFWDNDLLSGSATLTYHIDAAQFGYATYSRGNKSGGILLIGLAAGTPATVKPEELDDYEFGYKSSWFHNKLLFNADVYWEADHDYQTSIVQYFSNATTLTYLSNAKEAISRGAETDVRWAPTNGIWFSLSATYDDAYYASFASAPCALENAYNKTCDFTGSRLALTPKWAFALGGQYSHAIGHIGRLPLVGYAGATYTWQSSLFSATDDSEYSKVDGYGLLNINVGVHPFGAKWDLSAWVHNATNQRYFTLRADSSPLAAEVGAPLMFGFTLRLKL